MRPICTFHLLNDKTTEERALAAPLPPSSGSMYRRNQARGLLIYEMISRGCYKDSSLADENT